MPSGYPGALDSFTTTRADATAMATNHAQDHDDLADAVNKIEAELGINPSGAAATVAAVLAGALALVQETEVGVGGVGSINITPPTDKTHLLLMHQLKTDHSGSSDLIALRFNGDPGVNYRTQEFWGRGPRGANSDRGTVTVTIASPGVFTTPGNHQLIVGDKVVFFTDGALPTGLSSNTEYYVVAVPSATTFQVSAARGTGATAINTSGTQSGTHYLVWDRGAATMINESNNMRAGLTGASGGPANTVGHGVIFIPWYRKTNWNKAAICIFGVQDSVQGAALSGPPDTLYTAANFCTWLSTAAITAVNFLPNNGSNWLQNSRAAMYAF